MTPEAFLCILYVVPTFLLLTICKLSGLSNRDCLISAAGMNALLASWLVVLWLAIQGYPVPMVFYWFIVTGTALGVSGQ